jgi:anti-anti-sigma factor
MQTALRTTGTARTAGWEVETLDGDAVVRLSGEIDMAAVTAPPNGILAALSEACSYASLVTCDLSKVGFIDSSGIHLLVKLQDNIAKAGGRFVVAKPSHTVERLFEVVNASTLFEVVE